MGRVESAKGHVDVPHTAHENRRVQLREKQTRYPAAQDVHDGRANGPTRPKGVNHHDPEFGVRILGRHKWSRSNCKKTCFTNFNLALLSNAWKPAHLWLAPCWNGQALTLDSSTRWP